MSENLQQVLDRLDGSSEDAMDRLFAFLKIPSISTDPAYSDDCRRAAEWAASGQVTQEIPDDFPGLNEVRSRPFDFEK